MSVTRLTIVIALLVVTGCSGQGREDTKARALCESSATAKQIQDPYGIGYRVTVNGRLEVRQAWDSTVGLLVGWPPPSSEGPRSQPQNFWKDDAASRYIAVCYVHGDLTGQRGGVSATRSAFKDALIEVRDDHVTYLVSATLAGQKHQVQVPPHK